MLLCLSLSTASTGAANIPPVLHAVVLFRLWRASVWLLCAFSVQRAPGRIAAGKFCSDSALINLHAQVLFVAR